MNNKYIITVYNHIRALLVKFYHRSYYFALLANYIGKAFFYLKSRKKKKALNRLKQLIQEAHDVGKPVFIQFPVIPWKVVLMQRPQQIAKVMAEIGYLVIYILPFPDSSSSLKKVKKNIYITDQHTILNEIKNCLVSVYLNSQAIVNHYEKYLTNQFLRANIVFCEYVDDINEKIWGKYLTQVLQQRFDNLKYKDYKFLIASSDTLHKQLINHQSGHQFIYHIPNGVDLEHYNPRMSLVANLQLDERWGEAIDTRKKVIVYFGAIAPWIWSELVIELAKQRPNYFIVMIGPSYGDSPTFPNYDNLFFTGAVDYEELPLYGFYFHVCMIPFRLGEVAKTTSPLKLFEYFAIGRPIVVTSDLIECTKFDGVFSASTIDEFIHKVDEAANVRGDDLKILKEKYKGYAEENTWYSRGRFLDRIYSRLI